ncbi:AraC family transcriptional regulator [Novispirillum itersonii]|uniref:AraC-like DNA-binding protein n=1 Tax=Novispirillum itersonii TaxID=189 RepID=A0A7X0DM38_NOVIT|nr:AraC family transcriptional regulator [Novispirillum itersonii]MBB6208802.1 AraC-like DNA-binding protein [Novispirillum itersonii]
MPETHLQRSASLPAFELRKVRGAPVCFRPHSHDELSAGIIDSGLSTYLNRRQQERVGPGSVVTINAGDTHACNAEQVDWSYRMLFADPQWAADALNAEPGRPVPVFAGRGATGAGVVRRFDRAWTLLTTDAGPLETETAVIDLLSPLLETQPDTPPKRRRADPAMIRARDMILDHLGDPLPLAELSEAVGLTRSQLLHRFRLTWGQAPHACQLDERIKRAKPMLRRGDRSLSDIAQTLGFADQAHFQRHFRQRLALTPGQYRAFFRA